MSGVRKPLFLCQRWLHSLFHDGPTDTLKKRVVELEKMRKKKNHKKDELFVETTESKAFLDTATMPMILTVVGTALFAKLLMMYDDSKSQELIERRIKKAPPGQGTVRMVSREEWEEFREVRPRTPFESKLARANARIRTGEPLRLGERLVMRLAPQVMKDLCALSALDAFDNTVPISMLKMKNHQ